MTDNLAAVGAIFADPTRCEIVSCLMDGRAYTATELATLTHVGASTASHHLAILCENRIISVTPSGRHRHYQIYDEARASMIEAFGSIASTNPTKSHPLSLARCCYNHLAGQVGVELRTALTAAEGLVRVGEQYQLTTSGVNLLHDIGFAIPSDRERIGKACLDWTERVHHIGPPLGTFLLQEMRTQAWVEPGDIPRKLTITAFGQVALEQLGIRL